MNLQTVEMQINEAKQAMVLERKRHESAMKEFQAQLDKAQREKTLLMADFDVARIQQAEQILAIQFGGRYFDRTCVQDAIQDIAEDTLKMQREYFGSKNYSGWTNQRSDHTYCYGPRHGTIVCSIGLNREYRNGLTVEQKEDCLYYLNLLLDETKRGQLMERKTA